MLKKSTTVHLQNYNVNPILIHLEKKLRYHTLQSIIYHLHLKPRKGPKPHINILYR